MREISKEDFLADPQAVLAYACAGERLIVTEDGLPLFQLTPQTTAVHSSREAFDEFVAFGQKNGFALTPDEVHQSISEGRKY